MPVICQLVQVREIIGSDLACHPFRPYLPLHRGHPLEPLLARPHQPTVEVSIDIYFISLLSYLVEVGLQEVNPLWALEQSWPELLLQLLLSQNELDVLGCVVDLGRIDIDLIVEFQLNMV